MECKIENFYAAGDCIYCNKHIELDVSEGICIHELPACSQLLSCSGLREFAMNMIILFEDRGLRVFQKHSPINPRDNLKKLKS